MHISIGQVDLSSTHLATESLVPKSAGIFIGGCFVGKDMLGLSLLSLSEALLVEVIWLFSSISSDVDSGESLEKLQNPCILCKVEGVLAV